VRFEVARQCHDDRLLGRDLICANLFDEPIACILRVDVPTKLHCVTFRKTVMCTLRPCYKPTNERTNKQTNKLTNQPTN